MKRKRKYKRSYRKKDPRLNPRFQMEGKEIGNIKVISFSHTINRRSHWNCQCICGKMVVISRKNMHGRCIQSLSCGCIARKSPGANQERSDEEKKTHKLNSIINLSHPEGECRIWDGYLKGGIPRCTYLNKSYAVKRLIWLLQKGEIGKKLQVSNRCRNLKCIELNHLCLEPIGRNRWKK